MKREKAERERRKKITSLISQARAKDNKQDGKQALKLLKEALKLYPENVEALALQKKIRGYYGPNPGDVMANSIGMKLVWIPAGEFMMGSSASESGRFDNEGSQHQVCISKGFWMGQTEVTQAQWRSLMNNNPSYFKGNDLPVERLTWYNAVEFCEKLSRKERKTYRLPTEAQWEYACRAGTNTRFNFDDKQLLESYCWYRANSSGQTHPVAAKRPNAWGLYDMHGNVWEWCSDWYDEDYYSRSPSVDPQGPSSGKFRVLRGGSYQNFPRNCRSALRAKDIPDYRFDPFDGFRVILLDF